MPYLSNEVRTIVSQIGGITRLSGPDDPRLPDLRRDLEAAQTRAHARAILRTARNLTQPQRDLLAAICTTRDASRGSAA
jgi:hypothetical protein